MPSPPERIRAFISIALPEQLLEALHKFQLRLDRALPRESIRWTPLDQIHLTLKFLGNVESGQLDALQAALQPVAQRFPPLQLRAEGLGAFPSLRNPRVLWTALQGDTASLLQLQAEVERVAQTWTQKSEDRRFHPHLTLGRVRETAWRKARQIGQALEAITPSPFGQWQADHFRLMRSQLSPKGATHTLLAAFPFRSRT